MANVLAVVEQKDGTVKKSGREAIAAAKKILVDCGTIPKTQTLPTRLIDPSNAAKIYAEENPNG